MSRLLKVSRSGFYAWKKRPVSMREKENQILLKKIQDAYQAGMRSYGCPRIWAYLNKQGITCEKNRIARLMREHNIRAIAVKKYRVYSSNDNMTGVAPNILNQNFEISEPNRVWVSGITYIRTYEGWIYFQGK